MNAKIITLKKNEYGWVIDLVVIIEKIPDNTREVVEIVTKWAEEMKKKKVCKTHKFPVYGCKTCDERIFFDNLTRRKFHLGRIPRDTYHFDKLTKEDIERRDTVDIFVDEGSPFRYIYLVELRRERANISGLSAFEEPLSMVIIFSELK